MLTGPLEFVSWFPSLWEGFGGGTETNLAFYFLGEASTADIEMNEPEEVNKLTLPPKIKSGVSLKPSP